MAKKAKKLIPQFPSKEVGDLHEAIDRLFGESFVPKRSLLEMEIHAPSVNVSQTNKNVVVGVDIPGVLEKDLDIEVTEDTLAIKGERKEEKEEKKKDYYKRECSYGQFSRVISLPAVVESKKAKAKLKDGTLTVTVPKVEKVKPKTAKVKVKKK
jgi:HSP20 family protein